MRLRGVRVMRVLSLTVLAALFAAPAVADDSEPRLSSEELAAFLHQARPAKPGALSRRGDDSCQYANDRECDHPGIGTGACADGTDWSDCRFLIEGENDSCEWAGDGECDEPGLGTGVCTQGTDRTDCAGIIHLRFRNDNCATAFNGVCEEPGPTRVRGENRCAVRTDRADCVGRKRPLTINDHFRGYDDRVLFKTDVYPWTAIGQIDFEDGSACTASLVGRDILVTAAHCVHDSEGGLTVHGVFHAGFDRPEGEETADTIAYLVAPSFNHDLFSSTDKLDGADWTLLRINRPLGDTLGSLGVRRLTVARGITLMQAGYSWDTEGHLSGNQACRVIELNADSTLEHDCDTTQGDSGSPLLVREGEAYFVVGVDSNYRDAEDGPPRNIAARAMGFTPYINDFAAGTIGTAIDGPRKLKAAPGSDAAEPTAHAADDAETDTTPADAVDLSEIAAPDSADVAPENGARRRWFLRGFLLAALTMLVVGGVLSRMRGGA